MSGRPQGRRLLAPGKRAALPRGRREKLPWSYAKHRRRKASDPAPLHSPPEIRPGRCCGRQATVMRRGPLQGAILPSPANTAPENRGCRWGPQRRRRCKLARCCLSLPRTRVCTARQGSIIRSALGFLVCLERLYQITVPTHFKPFLPLTSLRTHGAHLLE